MHADRAGRRPSSRRPAPDRCWTRRVSRCSVGRRAAAVSIVVAGVGEDVVDQAAEREHDDDDQGGDGGDEQRVLDGRGALVVLLGLNGADTSEHCCSSGYGLLNPPRTQRWLHGVRGPPRPHRRSVHACVVRTDDGRRTCARASAGGWRAGDAVGADVVAVRRRTCAPAARNVAKTATMQTATIPASSRAYSTAEAPSSRERSARSIRVMPAMVRSRRRGGNPPNG